MTENNSKSLAAQTAVVILAAGKGTRMGRADTPKVCFEIDQQPAISRLIQTFKKKRFTKFVLIVGSMAEKVMQAVGKDHPETIFIFQDQQLGTGHAAQKAAAALENTGHTGPILVSMGDKHVEPEAITAIVEGYIKQQADFALLSVPKTRLTDASCGRIFLDESGQAVDIIEKVDLSKQAVADELNQKLTKSQKITPAALRKLLDKHIPQRKQKKAVPALLDLCENSSSISKTALKQILAAPEYNLTINEKKYSAAQIEKRCKGVNPSLYLFSSQAFYKGMSMLDNNNAQGEYYLTDVVRHLSGITDAKGNNTYRVRAVHIDDEKCIQGFNSPDELLEIQDYIRQKKPGKEAASQKPGANLTKNQFCTVKEWLEKIKQNKKSLNTWLTNIYGKHGKLHKEKCKSLTDVLNCYGKKFGFDEKVVIVRAPGRINLMGRHVDHRGAFNNFLAIDRETIAVAGVRNDENVIAVNVKPNEFKDVHFNIPELIGRFAWSDWINFVDSDWVKNHLRSTAGDWGNYIRAAMLRLQHKYQDLKIHGLNIALTGNVPIAAGLSSSSTIVVASLQAAIALNGLDLTSRQFIDLCGEGEWFVGSRGGAGDHAAIYLGQRGKIAHVGYLPFRVEGIFDAPRQYQVVIANSHVKAAKSSGAKHMFNSRIASYNLGLALLKQRNPQYAQILEYVRDIDPEKLGCKISDIYKMLLKVPQYMTRKQIKSALSPEHKNLIEQNFSSHDEPENYNIRGVLIFGASETARSKICIESLQTGQIEKFGELMKISHNGDRVAINNNDSYAKYPDFYSDEYLNELIANLAGEDPDKVLKAQLYMQPGAYACSTPEIDKMVDIATSVPGVAGAQIAGAGLGGCIMILAKKDCVENLTEQLTKNYYKPAKLKPAILPCIPVEGAGLAQF